MRKQENAVIAKTIWGNLSQIALDALDDLTKRYSFVRTFWRERTSKMQTQQCSCSPSHGSSSFSLANKDRLFCTK